MEFDWELILKKIFAFLMNLFYWLLQLKAQAQIEYEKLSRHVEPYIEPYVSHFKDTFKDLSDHNKPCGTLEIFDGSQIHTFVGNTLLEIKTNRDVIKQQKTGILFIYFEHDFETNKRLVFIHPNFDIFPNTLEEVETPYLSCLCTYEENGEECELNLEHWMNKRFTEARFARGSVLFGPAHFKLLYHSELTRDITDDENIKYPDTYSFLVVGHNADMYELTSENNKQFLLDNKGGIVVKVN